MSILWPITMTAMFALLVLGREAGFRQIAYGAYFVLLLSCAATAVTWIIYVVQHLRWVP